MHSGRASREVIFIGSKNRSAMPYLTPDAMKQHIPDNGAVYDMKVVLCAYRQGCPNKR